MKKPSVSTEASPYKSVAEELERLRKAFRVLSQRYSTRLETEILALRGTVLAAAETSPVDGRALSETATSPTTASSNGKKPAKRPAGKGAAAAEHTGRIHDLRDMLTLLRTFEVSPGVAKRRDFKRVENVLEELRLLASHWA